MQMLLGELHRKLGSMLNVWLAAVDCTYVKAAKGPTMQKLWVVDSLWYMQLQSAVTQAIAVMAERNADGEISCHSCTACQHDCFDSAERLLEERSAVAGADESVAECTP